MRDKKVISITVYSGKPTKSGTYLVLTDIGRFVEISFSEKYQAWGVFDWLEAPLDIEAHDRMAYWDKHAQGWADKEEDIVIHD